MERPIKGGYILISLGLTPLSTSYSGSIDYDRISKTKKHIVLTGIKIATTVMPDIAVKPIYGNGTITFEDVYGFDVVVSSNNSVSVSEHVVTSGTKLYKHSFKGLTPGDTERFFEVVSLSSNPITLNTNNVLKLINESLQFSIKNDENELIASDKNVIDVLINSGDLEFSGYTKEQITISEEPYTLLGYTYKVRIASFTGTDTVTEL